MFASTSPDSAKAALIRQDSGRFPRSDPRDWSYLIMTCPAFNATLSPDEIRSIKATAAAWRMRGYARTADNLLLVAGLTPPAPVRPQNVFRLADYRRAVQR